MTTILISSIYTCSISKKKKYPTVEALLTWFKCNIFLIPYLLFTYFPDFSDNLWATPKNAGCFNPILGKIWPNPAIGLRF